MICATLHYFLAFSAVVVTDVWTVDWIVCESTLPAHSFSAKLNYSTFFFLQLNLRFDY